MRIVVTQPDDQFPLAWVELDLTQYSYRDRRHHAGIPVHDDVEWKFRLDQILVHYRMMRLTEWDELRDTTRFRHYKKSIVAYRAYVRLDK